MTFRSSLKAGAAVLTVGVLGAGAGAIASAETGGPTIPAKAQEVNSSTVANFGLFRESPATLPSKARTAIEKSQTSESHGISTSLARSVNVDGLEGPVVVAPGSNGICLWVPLANSEFGASCAPTAEAERGRLWVQLLDAKGASTIVALVPDGAKSARVTTESGETKEMTIVRNVAIVHATKVANLQVGTSLSTLAK